jgi:hypothetical protein
MAAPRRLGIVVFHEKNRTTWTARVLEHDLAAQGRTMESALDTLVKLIRAHVAYDRGHSRPPLSAFAAAPDGYWSAFDGATELPVTIDIDWHDPDVSGRVIAAVAPEPPRAETPSIANAA